MYRKGGWKPDIAPKWMAYWKSARDLYVPSVPPWIGDETLHLSHQANLVRKDAQIYNRLFPGVEPMTGYYWPRLLDDGGYELYFKETNR
jgi:hypothetical protein